MRSVGNRRSRESDAGPPVPGFHVEGHPSQPVHHADDLCGGRLRAVRDGVVALGRLDRAAPAGGQRVAARGRCSGQSALPPRARGPGSACADLGRVSCGHGGLLCDRGLSVSGEQHLSDHRRLCGLAARPAPDGGGHRARAGDNAGAVSARGRGPAAGTGAVPADRAVRHIVDRDRARRHAVLLRGLRNAPQLARGGGAAPKPQARQRRARGQGRAAHAGTLARERCRRAGEPRQRRLPGQHEPRDPHADGSHSSRRRRTTCSR